MPVARCLRCIASAKRTDSLVGIVGVLVHAGVTTRHWQTILKIDFKQRQIEMITKKDQTVMITQAPGQECLCRGEP